MSSKWMIRNWTTGELNALVKNLGGEEAARKIQRGEAKVSLKDVLKALFDKHGRRIPEGLQAKVCDADRHSRLNQPKLDEEVDFANRISRLHECLSIDTKVTAEKLKAETERLLAMIRENSQIANIANGVYLPVVLPKLVTDDLGAEMELYLAGGKNSYNKTFSDRNLNNYREGDLGGKVSIINGSRHDRLIAQMKECPVIGLHFPNPLQGFSIQADREQMPTLPEGFILSGLDTLIAMAMYPDIWTHDYVTLRLDLAALQWKSDDFSLFFWHYGNELIFDITAHLTETRDNHSSGLLFLG